MSLLWADLETTGLNPERDKVLEVGLVITDDDLNEVARASWLVWSGFHVDELQEFTNDFVKEMHTTSGLWDEYEIELGNMYRDRETHLLSLWDLEDAMINFISDLDQPYLAGATINFDRSFLAAYFPKFHDKLHYRNVDVTSVKRLAAMWAPDLYEGMPAERKIHRALPDIDDSIAQLLHFKNTWLNHTVNA